MDVILEPIIEQQKNLGVVPSETKLDIYEGMWHVFLTAPSPKTEVSLKKVNDAK